MDLDGAKKGSRVRFEFPSCGSDGRSAGPNVESESTRPFPQGTKSCQKRPVSAVSQKGQAYAETSGGSPGPECRRVRPPPARTSRSYPTSASSGGRSPGARSRSSSSTSARRLRLASCRRRSGRRRDPPPTSTGCDPRAGRVVACGCDARATASPGCDQAPRTARTRVLTARVVRSDANRRHRTCLSANRTSHASNSALAEPETMAGSDASSTFTGSRHRGARPRKYRERGAGPASACVARGTQSRRDARGAGGHDRRCKLAFLLTPWIEASAGRLGLARARGLRRADDVGRRALSPGLA